MTRILLLAALLAAAPLTASAQTANQKTDSVANGAAIGAVTGLAAAIGLVRAKCHNSSERDDCHNLGYLIMSAILVPAGALIGIQIDQEIGRSRIVVAPTLGPGFCHVPQRVFFQRLECAQSNCFVAQRRGRRRRTHRLRHRGGDFEKLGEHHPTRKPRELTRSASGSDEGDVRHGVPVEGLTDRRR